MNWGYFYFMLFSEKLNTGNACMFFISSRLILISTSSIRLLLKVKELRCFLHSSTVNQVVFVQCCGCKKHAQLDSKIHI